MNAVIYARVSSKHQEREGYSIQAQLKLLREYAQSHEFQIVREFVDVETAKTTGRKQFGEMVRFLEENADSRVVIVEKTDRLYRNFRDCVTLEDLGVEIHLPKEGQIIGKNARSQEKLIHGIQVVIARNYIENLREEVRKGMREKAEQGVYPSRPPLGYRNNKLERSIEVDPAKAPLARRMFELYATGRCSLFNLGKAIQTEFGVWFGKGYLERLLKNPFYAGSFRWEDRIYAGTHTPLVDRDLFEAVQAVFRSHNKPKHRKREFAFAGLLTCAYDECSVTAEIKREKYIYYHCTGHRGKCELPYFREEHLGERLADVLRDVHIPDGILQQIVRGLQTDQGSFEKARAEKCEQLQQRLATIRRRIEQAYTDKLDGAIPEEFWNRKSAEWQAEESEVLGALNGLDQAAGATHVANATRILELANRACFLYLKQDAAERAKLLKLVVSNCRIDALNLYPTYRKPFDLIARRAKTGGWYAREDSNL